MESARGIESPKRDIQHLLLLLLLLDVRVFRYLPYQMVNALDSR